LTLSTCFIQNYDRNGTHPQVRLQGKTPPQRGIFLP
jgi:hypothetical protein